MNVLVQIAYHGAAFHGCPPVPGLRTVAGEVSAALLRLGQNPALVECLSRTDAGVHARGNVVFASLSREGSLQELLFGLDRQLPPDLRPVAAANCAELPAPSGKTYSYTLDVSRFGDPLRAPFAWRPGPLDPEILRSLAAELPGVRDFEGFRRRGETRERLVRRVDEASWSFGQDLAIFRIHGEGFGYRVVRSLVGAMVRVGRGGAEPEAFLRLLAGELHDLGRDTAPAQGLCLERVVIPAVSWVSADR